MLADHISPEFSRQYANRSLEAAAQVLYEKRTRVGLVERVKIRFGQEAETRLCLLDDVLPQIQTYGRKALGQQTVRLSHIVGTTAAGRARDFNVDFRPLQQHNRERWLGVAAAWIGGRRLGCVKLIQVGDVYFVQDGHHRISVALALGEPDIEAKVIQLQGSGTLSPPVTEEKVAFAGSPTLKPAYGAGK